MTRKAPVAGRDERITEAYLQEWSATVRYARRFSRDPAEAEDFAQEAFVRLVRAAADGEWPTNAAAWLRRVVANLAISSHRHAVVVARVAARTGRDAMQHGFDADPLRSASSREEADALLEAIRGLAPDRRTATLLAAEGFSAGEIGSRLGRSPASIRTLLCRARRSLRIEVSAALAG